MRPSAVEASSAPRCRARGAAFGTGACGADVNDDVAEYLVATNADVPQVDIILVPEDDNQVNPLGVKGIGELGNVAPPAGEADPCVGANTMASVR